MNKKTIIFILIVLGILFLNITMNTVYAQKSLDDILYGDFAEIDNFGYIFVKIQGENSSLIGLDSYELTNYAKLKYKNNFSGIDYREITADEYVIFQEEEKAKKTGSIWFRIWTAGEGYPIVYYIECKAGNYQNYDIWNDEVLGFCDEKEINQIARTEITRMIENFAITFFKVRGEI
ncbi:MAG: hypothetical protein PHD33_03460 [Atribacterota bacterium]|nr:hypothetical protein [Atribacterota bacterium]